MIARAPAWLGNTERSRSNSTVRGRIGVPLPCSRTIFGGPSKAQNIKIIRLFSRRWARVSMPRPVKSRYATSMGLRMRNESSPFGEQLTNPSAASGAVATKKIRCYPIHVARSGLMASRMVRLRLTDCVASQLLVDAAPQGQRVGARFPGMRSRRRCSASPRRLKERRTERSASTIISSCLRAAPAAQTSVVEPVASTQPRTPRPRAEYVLPPRARP